MYYEFPESPESYTYDRQVSPVPVYNEIEHYNSFTWLSFKCLCIQLLQYFFGSDILVAPVTQPVDNATQMATKEIWIPEVLRTLPPHIKIVRGRVNLL